MSDAIATASLARRYPGVESGTLLRYERAGWISPAVAHRGSGGGRELLWPRWVERLVAMFQAERTERAGFQPITPEGAELRRRLAEAVAVYPTAVWFVDTGEAALVPAWTDTDALGLVLGHPGPARTMVSPPLI